MSSSPQFNPKPHLGYAGNLLDRAADRRADPAALSALAQRDDCGFYVVSNETIVLKTAGKGFDPLFTTAETGRFPNVTERVFLGLLNGSARFGLGIASEAADALKTHDGFHVTDLRSIAVQGLVDADHLGPIAEAKALLHWHARRRFCSNCGKPNMACDGGWRRECTHCGMQHFPRTDPVVIMLTVAGERCLLGRQARFAQSMWSCLAGFVEPGETIEEAARRETLEEAGIVCGRVRYFASQPWPFPSSLMIGCHAQALSEEITVDRNELEDARWFSRDEAAAMLLRQHPQGLTTPPPVAIAHHIIRDWVETGERFFEPSS
ncbi:MAG: NAD(+) diphosphatase [Pseudorhodoplanes sp.]|jgi:NAD+ diphosphatase|nr:NAD(+) diphosphatase [Pseudorhodoplanes sp.]